MTRITGDDFMLVGLHKMAAERGDGLIPEMIDMLKRSGEVMLTSFDHGPDFVQLPTRRSESVSAVRPASNENNVIAFPIARRR